MDWLKLSENTQGPRYFVNESGKPINFFGMARCQSCCATERKLHGDAGDVAAYFKNLKCNIIRLAIHICGNSGENDGMVTDKIEYCGGYNTEGINKFIDEFVDPEVQQIKAQGMYIQLDLHDYPQRAVQGDDAIVKFATDYYIPIWQELAKRYKDDPYVAVYEIWNEPYPADVATAVKDSPEWVASIREFFIKAVKAIREIDQRHVIMVSDYNAGWGKAWEVCWKDYHKDLDEYNNTCYSIHIARKQLEKEHPDYADWMVRMADENNVCLFMGEVETEGEPLMSEQSLANLLELMVKTEDTHHFASVLWRPRGDEINRVDQWRDVVAKYTEGTIEF